MGVCLSCLGLRDQRRSHDEADRQRLLYDDYPAGHHYGTWGTHTGVAPENLMSPEEVQREQRALDHISRWASDQIVEIFPHSLGRALGGMGMSTSLLNGSSGTGTGTGSRSTSASNLLGLQQQQQQQQSQLNGAAGSSSQQQHQDILLSLIPGDKARRSIRIYPASRPTSKSGQSLRSKSSVLGNNGPEPGRKRGDSSVLVTLDVNLP